MTVTRWSQNLASGSSLALQSLGNGRPGRLTGLQCLVEQLDNCGGVLSPKSERI